MSTPRLLTRRDRRRSGAIIAGAATLSAGAVSALVFTATNAAFSDTTDNGGNSFAAGTVVLSDDDSGTALFNVSGMVPGDTETECIEVEYEGTIVGADLDSLVLYGTSSGDLASELDLTVQRSAAGGDCTSFTSAATVYSGDLTSLGTTFAAGSAGLTPSAQNEVVAYQISVTLPAATPNSAQGDTATASFTWEVTT
ncbi:MAG: TasA family protein [Actinomycetota bacterium]